MCLGSYGGLGGGLFIVSEMRMYSQASGRTRGKVQTFDQFFLLYPITLGDRLWVGPRIEHLLSSWDLTKI